MARKKENGIKIDLERFDKWQKENNLTDHALCRKIGRSNGYLYARKKRGTMPEHVLALMCDLFDLEHDFLVVKPAPENKMEITIAEILKQLEEAEYKLAEVKNGLLDIKRKEVQI